MPEPKEIWFFCGRNVDDMSREELLRVVKKVMQMHADELQESHRLRGTIGEYMALAASLKKAA